MVPTFRHSLNGAQLAGLNVPTRLNLQNETFNLQNAHTHHIPSADNVPFTEWDVTICRTHTAPDTSLTEGVDFDPLGDRYDPSSHL